MSALAPQLQPCSPRGVRRGTDRQSRSAQSQPPGTLTHPRRAVRRAWAAVAARVTERAFCAVWSRRRLPSCDSLGAADRALHHRLSARVDLMRVLGLSALVAAAMGGLAYRLIVSGKLTLDTGVGRTLRPLGPLAVTIVAPRETV